MEILSAFLVAAFATTLCLLLTLRSSRPRPNSLKSIASRIISPPSYPSSPCACPCTCGTAPAAEMVERATVERQSGASMMEQLVPEITTHALSYLDFSSLCRLSMTNSLMRKAANDDNAWKALYHKDFTLEQDSMTPVNGWKAYYAATRAIVTINAEFINIIREGSISSMRRLWLNTDYVKCFHDSGELFSGYDAVIQSWQLAFWDRLTFWGRGVNFQVRDVRVRVLTDMAWVSMKALVNVDSGPFHMTNVYEIHNGRWYLVHHHSSMMVSDGVVEQQQQNAHGHG